MSFEQSWKAQEKKLKVVAQEKRDYDSIIEWMAAKSMASSAFSGDYEMALDGAQFDYDLASGVFDDI